MSFRDLTTFNKALLVKQLWRMVINPDHLVAKVFKARYFKHTNIMNATLGTKPSYIWCSLLWSRYILQEGICWKVKNGEHINARRDIWILELSSGKTTSHVSYDSNIKISALFHSLTT